MSILAVSRPFALLTACLAVLAASAPALAASAASTAPAGSAPQATTALYRDWQLHCVAAPNSGSSGQQCEVAGVVPTADGKGAAARVVIGRPDPKKPAQMVIQLAPGVWLPDGASVTVPGIDAPIKAEFKQCVQICFAQTELTDADVSAMQVADKPAALAFTDATRQVVSLPLSLNGFAAAFEASKSSGK